jgi:hypothetical protein
MKQAFDVLQTRWDIVCHRARTWNVQTMHDVMIACVIPHNMIVEQERDDNLHDQGWQF